MKLDKLKNEYIKNVNILNDYFIKNGYFVNLELSSDNKELFYVYRFKNNNRGEDLIAFYDKEFIDNVNFYLKPHLELILKDTLEGESYNFIKSVNYVKITK